MDPEMIFENSSPVFLSTITKTIKYYCDNDKYEQAFFYVTPTTQLSNACSIQITD